jgi:hypothetical protein
MWGGNNEVAQIIAGSKVNFVHHNKSGKEILPAIQGNYSHLFWDAIGKTIEREDSSRKYVPTSPGSGHETAAAPMANVTMSPAQGDMHVYVYDGNCLDPTRYSGLQRVRAGAQ